MESLRFQPPGCRIWVVATEDGPAEGRFLWDTRSDGEPCRPELHVSLALDRSELFRLAMDCEQRWTWVLEAHEQRKRQQEAERRREEEAAARWDEIRARWEETKRRAEERRRAARPAPVIVAAPRCVELLGLPWPCSEDEIKRAFRDRAKLLHPDAGGSEAAFIELRQAYEEALELL